MTVPTRAARCIHMNDTHAVNNEIHLNTQSKGHSIFNQRARCQLPILSKLGGHLVVGDLHMCAHRCSWSPTIESGSRDWSTTLTPTMHGPSQNHPNRRPPPRTFLQQSSSISTSRRTAGQDAFRKYALDALSTSNAPPGLPREHPALTRVEWSLCELLRMRV